MTGPVAALSGGSSSGGSMMTTLLAFALALVSTLGTLGTAYLAYRSARGVAMTEATRISLLRETLEQERAETAQLRARVSELHATLLMIVRRWAPPT